MTTNPIEADEPRAPLVPDATLDYLIAKYGTIRPDERAVAVDREAARAMLDAANTVKATGGAVEIGGVRIEPCDEFGSSAPARVELDLDAAVALISKVDGSHVRRELFAIVAEVRRVSRENEALRARVAAVEALAESMSEDADMLRRAGSASYANCTAMDADALRAALATNRGGPVMTAPEPTAEHIDAVADILRRHLPDWTAARAILTSTDPAVHEALADALRRSGWQVSR